MSSPRTDTDPRVWLIRAGRFGQGEQTALTHGVAVIGWTELGAVQPEDSREQLKDRIRVASGEERSSSLASQAGQIYRFVHEVALGDVVALPLRTMPNHVAIGRVTGDYAYRAEEPFLSTDAANTREVDWLARDLPYERFDADLREAFGQQGTVSEISKPAAAQRLLAVVEGADASAIHLVLKWSPKLKPDTIERHREVAETSGSVWWGRYGKPGATGLAAAWQERFQQQLEQGSTTHVFLHAAATTWRTRMVALTDDKASVDASLIPSYYAETGLHHTLWVQLTDFEEVEPAEIIDNFVLAQSGEPVTPRGLGNQGPLILRSKGATTGTKYFILNQGQGDGGPYEDDEGRVYHWTDNSSGAWKQLANSPGARFVYYRTGKPADDTGQTYFGAGGIASIAADERDGERHFVAELHEYTPFDMPVSREHEPSQRNVQMSIQEISEMDYERLVALGFADEPEGEFTPESVRATAEARGLQLPTQLYAQVVAALESGKHIILTGPPGTAKTTLAQALADTARASGRAAGYVLTTATADWTTYETIGGLRPTREGDLEFEEGHFLHAIRENQWLVIDELNRSNFDRAFGQLFTVLSGQAVVLPYIRPNETRPLVLVPEGADIPIPDPDALTIPQSWRVIATMNVFDKTLLFEMSFALMRRFAFVEVPSPSRAVFEALIDRESGGDDGAAEIAKRLLDLRSLKDVGPAVFMDIARFLRMRRSLDPDADDRRLLFEAFYGYLLPQFEGVADREGEELFSRVGALVGPQRDHLRRTLNSVLGLELQPPRMDASEAEELDETAEEEQPE